MVDGSCHGVRRTKEGPGLQAQNGVEMLMHRAWVTHRRCPLALEQSEMGGAGINVNQKKTIKKMIKHGAALAGAAAKRISGEHAPAPRPLV